MRLTGIAQHHPQTSKFAIFLIDKVKIFVSVNDCTF